MSRILNLVAATLCLATTLVAQSTARHSLSESQQSSVKAWLSTHHGYRQATDADCECEDDIRSVRRGYGGQWKPVPDYHPYIATGDFNGDGYKDFAVVVVDTSKSTKKFTLLVFNGPLNRGSVAPAYTEANVDMKATGMFFGPPRPKPYRLVIGAFESEGYVLLPKGKTYVIDVSTVGE